MKMKNLSLLISSCNGKYFQAFCLMLIYSGNISNLQSQINKVSVDCFGGLSSCGVSGASFTVRKAVVFFVSLV